MTELFVRCSIWFDFAVRRLAAFSAEQYVWLYQVTKK